MEQSSNFHSQAESRVESFNDIQSNFRNEINVLSLQKGNLSRPINQDSFQSDTRFFSFDVKDLSIGTKFAAFRLYDNRLIFLKTEEYLNPIPEIDTLLRINTREGVKSYYTGAKNFIYQTQDGQIHIVFDEPNKSSNQLTEVIIESTIKNPVHSWSASYCSAIFEFNNEVVVSSGDNSSTEDEIEEEKKIKELETQISKKLNKRVIKALNLADLSPQNLNESTRITEISGLDGIKLCNFCVGSNLAYFVDDAGITYECCLNTKRNGKLEAISYEPFKKKSIKRILTGGSYFFAIEQDHVKGIRSWTNEQVVNWARKSGFEEYCKILEYEFVTGETLANADRRYIIDTLGITSEDVQAKFFYEINKVKEDSKSVQKLYSWGLNNGGQLALHGKDLNVKFPQLVPLPKFYEKEEISNIECGLKCSVILTNLGRVFISGPGELKEKIQNHKVEKDNSDFEKEDRKLAKREKNIKSNKSKVKYVNEESEIKSPKTHRWEDISILSINLKSRKLNKIISVSLNKDHLVVLCSFVRHLERDEDPNEALLRHQTARQKLRGAEYVINRIIWDSSYNKADFNIGYEDRFLGILEIPFEEFIVSEVPKHRIRFFKMGEKLMWDRTRRINMF